MNDNLYIMMENTEFYTSCFHTHLKLLWCQTVQANAEYITANPIHESICSTTVVKCIVTVSFQFSHTCQCGTSTDLVFQPIAGVTVIVNRLEAWWKHMHAKHVFFSSVSTEVLKRCLFLFYLFIYFRKFSGRGVAYCPNIC